MPRTKKFTINDAEREMWVNNDEYWHNRWKRYRGSMRSFLKENREELDDMIRKATGNDKDRSHLPDSRSFQ